MCLIRVVRWIVFGLIGVIVVVLGAALIAYPSVYVYRVMAWRESDAFDCQRFPSRFLTPAAVPYRFPVALNPRVGDLLGRLSGTGDWDGFLEAQGTQAFVVIQGPATAAHPPLHCSPRMTSWGSPQTRAPRTGAAPR